MNIRFKITILATLLLSSIATASFAQTTVNLGQQCDCNDGNGPWTNTNNTAATTSSSTIRFLGQKLGIGVNPLNAFQLKNNVGNDNSAGTSSFDAYTDYQILLYKGGSPNSSYGIGIEGYTLAFNSYRDVDWNIRGADKMTLSTAGLGIGVRPEAPLHLGNNVGADNSAGTSSFSNFSDYQVLLYRGGSAVSSYGMGIESGTFALNANSAFDWNLRGSDKMTLTNTGLGIGVKDPVAALQFSNAYGNGASFDSYSDYKVLLYRGGNSRQSYGIGIEGATLAFNTYRDIDWKVQGTDKMTLSPNGLAVFGNITATGSITPDYVFEQYYEGTSTLNPAYEMMDLAAIKAYTHAHKHLPGVPSAAEVEAAGGIVLNRQSEIHLEKIEELFLHTIEQQERIEALEAALERANAKHTTLEERLLAIESLLKKAQE
ncbi:MAG: hypothetical protein AAF828_09505 [Bacteroidota bacterium]